MYGGHRATTESRQKDLLVFVHQNTMLSIVVEILGFRIIPTITHIVSTHRPPVSRVLETMLSSIKDYSIFISFYKYSLTGST